jgi:hypothetical protein
MLERGCQSGITVGRATSPTNPVSQRVGTLARSDTGLKSAKPMIDSF